MSKELLPWAKEAEWAFNQNFGDAGCTCFISPPCSFCTHEGNPRNLEETPDAWGELHEVMALEAQESLANFINERVKHHLLEMKREWHQTGVAT